MYNLPIPCVILARKNSKGLKDKNIYKLNNLSLVEHSIIYAKKSKLVSDIIVSTDDIRIKRISEKYKCFTIFPRPKTPNRTNELTTVKKTYFLNVNI